MSSDNGLYMMSNVVISLRHFRHPHLPVLAGRFLVIPYAPCLIKKPRLHEDRLPVLVRRTDDFLAKPSDVCRDRWCKPPRSWLAFHLIPCIPDLAAFRREGPSHLPRGEPDAHLPWLTLKQGSHLFQCIGYLSAATVVASSYESRVGW